MLPLLILLSFVAVVLLKMGFIFVLLALLPSVAAYYIDNDPRVPIFKTVLACNCASLLPVIYPMLKAAMAFERFNSFAVMTDPFNWLVAYGGAALGWCLIFLCRFVAHFMVVLAYDYQIRSLEQNQKQLLKEWGDDIKQAGIP